MKKLINSVCIIFILLSSLELADGGMFIRRPDGWQLHPEERQLCAINYENGYQNMILSINFDSDTKGSEKAVWIFPIPAKPEDTRRKRHSHNKAAVLESASRIFR